MFLKFYFIRYLKIILVSSDIHNSVDELHNCATVSSATHPDSTRSPEELSENSSYSIPSATITDSTDIVQSEYSRPRRDLRSNRHCEFLFKLF